VKPVVDDRSRPEDCDEMHHIAPDPSPLALHARLGLREPASPVGLGELMLGNRE